MGLIRIVYWGYRCLRCAHTWAPLNLEKPRDGSKPEEPTKEPLVCPKCKSPYWNRQRKEEKK